MAMTFAAGRTRQAVLVALLPVAVVLGMSVASNRGSLTLVSIGLVAGGTVVAWPSAGLYVTYPLLLWVPYGALHLNVPLFHSPLQVIAILTLGVAIARHLLKRERLPPSRLYLPATLFVAATGLFALAGHGPAATERFVRLTQGFWPMVAIVLLVKTPRQARHVLIVVQGSFAVLALLWLPGLLHFSGATPAAVRSAGTSAPAGGGLSLRLLGIAGSLDYITLVAMAIATPIVLSGGLGVKRLRLPALAAFAALATAMALSTFAAALVGLAVGTVATALLSIRRRGTRRSSLHVLPVVAVLAILVIFSPPAQHSIQRLQHASADASGRERLTGLSQGWKAFVDQPLTGAGVYSTYTVTSRGRILDAHNSAVVLAYEYGLVGLVPFIWLLCETARLFLLSLRGAKSEIDQAVAGGMLAALMTTVALTFVTPVFGQVYADTVLWTLAGLGIVWRNWQPRQLGSAFFG